MIPGAAFPRTCGNCGAVHTRRDWQRLQVPNVGATPYRDRDGNVYYGPGCHLQYRQCRCGSTLAVAADERTLRELEVA